jgi:hypothetical protein
MEHRTVTVKRIQMDAVLDTCAYRAGSLDKVRCVHGEPCDAPLNVPKELWLILNMLNECAVRMPGLFTMPGLHDEHRAIAEYLDTGVLTERRMCHGYVLLCYTFHIVSSFLQ